jgi:molecular chaperone GrpE
MQSSRATERTEAEHAPEPEPTAEEERLRAELGEMEVRYKRALADLDNYRKRSERETARLVQEAREDLLRDWLEALDSVEFALHAQPEDQGLQAVLVQMEAILWREGATRVGAVGERFDPKFNDAVAVRTSEELPEWTILEVTRSGFALSDKLLRPAQVVVSQRESRG